MEQTSTGKAQETAAIPLSADLDWRQAVSWGPGGLVPAVAVEATTGEVLMVAWVNQEALERTISTGKAWYWSRSRKQLWCKGETSGNLQLVREVLADCDSDTLIYKVDQLGTGACHTGSWTCFQTTLAKRRE
jgi:phosphoribosyl-AMP cyclohydrolase